MSWITYKIIAVSGTKFTHFSRSENLNEAQAEWEQKFNQKAVSIAVDDDDTELNFFDLFEVVPEVERHVSTLIQGQACYDKFIAEVQQTKASLIDGESNNG